MNIKDLVDALRAKHQHESDGIVSSKNFNILAMGAIGAAAALVWSTVTNTPKDFGVIQQQTAEIRTTVLEMKSTLSDINGRLESNTRATSEQQAKITGLESTVKSNTDRLDRLEEEVKRDR